jgi:hypothetical protein
VAKFQVKFSGRLEDVVAELGVSLNGLIRKLAAGQKPVRGTFLTVEHYNAEWVRKHVALAVAQIRFCHHGAQGDFNEALESARLECRTFVDEWVDEHRAKLAEVGFLFDEADLVKKYDRFGRLVR